MSRKRGKDLTSLPLKNLVSHLAWESVGFYMEMFLRAGGNRGRLTGGLSVAAEEQAPRGAPPTPTGSFHLTGGPQGVCYENITTRASDTEIKCITIYSNPPTPTVTPSLYFLSLWIRAQKGPHTQSRALIHLKRGEKGKKRQLMHFHPWANKGNNGRWFCNLLSFPVDKARQAFPRRSPILAPPPTPPCTHTRPSLHNPRLRLFSNDFKKIKYLFRHLSRQSIISS